MQDVSRTSNSVNLESRLELPQTLSLTLPEAEVHLPLFSSIIQEVFFSTYCVLSPSTRVQWRAKPASPRPPGAPGSCGRAWDGSIPPCW